jgi:hypothetical protein
MFTRAKASYEVVTLGGSVISTGESPRAAIERHVAQQTGKPVADSAATEDDVKALLPDEDIDASELPIVVSTRAPESSE